MVTTEKVTPQQVYELRKTLNTALFEREAFAENAQEAERESGARGRIGSLSSYWESPAYKALDKAVAEANAALEVAQVEIGGRVYLIPAENLAGLEQRVEKLARRSKKTGTPPVTVTVTEEFEEETREDDGEVTHVITRYYVIVGGQTPVIPGWEFVAVVDHLDDDNNLIREIPQIRQEVRGITPGDLTPYLHAAPDCDHCGVDRRRKETFILQAREDGSLKQVGRQCLGDFTGIHNPDQVAKWAEYLIEFEDTLADAEERDSSGGGGTPVLPLDGYLTHVVTMIREFGYTSGTRAREWGGSSTKETAQQNFYNARSYDFKDPAPRDRYNTPKYYCPTAEDKAEAAQTLAWAHENYTTEAVDAAIDAGNPSEATFLNNMRVAFASDYAQPKVLGFLAWAPMARRKAIETQVREEKKVKAVTLGYKGEPGEKFEWELTVAKIVEIEDHYSYNQNSKPLYIFVDDDGREVKWFSSRWIGELEPGATVVLKGTVKGQDDGKGRHGDSNYAPSTTVTRCKVLEVKSEQDLDKKAGES